MSKGELMKQFVLLLVAVFALALSCAADSITINQPGGFFESYSYAPQSYSYISGEASNLTGGWAEFDLSGSQKSLVDGWTRTQQPPSSTEGSVTASSIRGLTSSTPCSVDTATTGQPDSTCPFSARLSSTSTSTTVTVAGSGAPLARDTSSQGRQAA